MKSMTGFGRASQQTAHFEIDINVRAVNGRFLEVRFHLPREYASFESEMKKLVQSHLARGTVDVYINRRLRGEAADAKVTVRKDLAKLWVGELRKLGKSLKLKGDISFETLARVSDLWDIEEESAVSADEKEAVLAVLKTALDQCVSERVREGKALQKELLALLADLGACSDEIEACREHANSELEKRLKDRLQKLGIDTSLEPQRLAQEVVMLVDRADISEELTRLREHLKAYREILSSRTHEGKKLDFYAQELLREVNTIGSKSQVARLTNHVVDAKTIVERIREQVQNVE